MISLFMFELIYTCTWTISFKEKQEMHIMTKTKYKLNNVKYFSGIFYFAY